MATMYKAPNNKTNTLVPKHSVFLAGSIEQGKAEDWQTKIFNDLSEYDIDVYNPRRAVWNSSWKQDISNKKFKEQVDWELTHLETVDTVVFYFDPTTMSPVTMLELGIQLEQKHMEYKNVFVCCPDGFWRKGNIQIVCERYGVILYDHYSHMIDALKKFFRKVDMAKTQNFMTLAISGKIADDELQEYCDYYVDSWNGSDYEETRNLHEFLGMTFDEYKNYLEKKNSLHDLVQERRKLTSEAEESK